MFIYFTLLISVAFVLARGGPATENYKDQFCTDPRTMKKHAAYTEWADAYSCTRHRCQPGGRNLAIYTVGCKRVEAPESAIECEEVVEDTNMQFPYCCTRLRCLVVVRGEVWTRVLGQPWETLPAAPWSHMYKMKKPPPADSSFLPKNSEGPVYELAQDPPAEDKNRRAKKMDDNPVAEIRPRAMSERNNSPDIVIALSTGNEKEGKFDNEKEYNKPRSRRNHNKPKNPSYPPVADHSAADDDLRRDEIPDDVTEKDLDASEESTRLDSKPKKQTWTPEFSHSWPKSDVKVETVNADKETDNVPEFHSEDKLKPNNLQDLVDAIGTRMRDIENVVQKMSEKVRKPENENDFSLEKRSLIDDQTSPSKKTKRTDTDPFKRYPKSHGNKYQHNNQELSTEKSPFPEEAVNLNGFFSDASNTVRRSVSKDSPAAIYMAPVENRRAGAVSDASDLEDAEKKHKKHHKKKKNKSAHHKKHHANAIREEKRPKSFNKISSLEMQMSSPEDNSLNL